ncbi:MAG TPA: universal stress protein [Longimicrobiales bacterium]|nr:universal stress protein [Longimicrobiales bacterium]
MTRDILVPLDGSTFSEHAVPVALDLARRTGGRLHLVQVHEPVTTQVHADGLPMYDERWDGALRAQEEEYLRSLAGTCMEHAGVSPVVELLDGPVVPALTSYALETGAGHIVMTTHGRGGISRVWMGSVADALVRRAAVPVLLVRPKTDDVTWTRGLAPRHILIPLDGSELAEGILDPAQELGALSDARYTLLRVVLPLPFIMPPAAMGAVYSEAGAEASKDTAAKYLTSVANRMRARGARVDVATVFHTSPALGILDFAATHAVDMVAMATHGRGGWSRVALGSVADKVMRGTMMPVLLLRPEKAAATPQVQAGREGGAATEPGAPEDMTGQQRREKVIL